MVIFIIDCSFCSLVWDGYFMAFFVLVNGSYLGGQEVQMCFIVDCWFSMFNSELLYVLEFDFDEGWDMAIFLLQFFVFCFDNGVWGWYNGWFSEVIGDVFGFGFVFDEIKNGIQDGNLGNNCGMDGFGCVDIGGVGNDNILQFCWIIIIVDCLMVEFGYFVILNMGVRLLGDGFFGVWG